VLATEDRTEGGTAESEAKMDAVKAGGFAQPNILVEKLG